MVGMGLIPNRATNGIPLVMPPSVPPSLLVFRCQGRSMSVTGCMTSCTCEPR